MNIKQNKMGIISIISFQILLASSAILTKTMPIGFSSSLFIFVRLSLAVIVITLMIITIPKLKNDLKKITRPQLLRLFYLGFWSSGIGFLFYTLGIRNAGAGIGSVLANLEVVTGTIVAMIVLKEKMKKIHLMYLIGIVMGLLLIIKIDNRVIYSSTFFLGVTCALIAAVVFGIGNVFAKLLINSSIPIWIVSYIRCVAGAIFAVIFSLITERNISKSFTLLQYIDWVKLLYLGCIFSSLGQVVSYFGLKRMTVKDYSIFYACGPAFSLVGGLIFLKENILLTQWAGIGILLTTIIVFIKYK